MIFLIFGIESWALGVYAADQVLYLKTIGVGSLTSSGALGAAAGIAAVSGIVFSRLSDRSSPYYVLIFSTSLMALGSIAFLNAHNAVLLWVYSALFGAGYGLTVPTIPVALSRYFGRWTFPRRSAFGRSWPASWASRSLGHRPDRRPHQQLPDPDLPDHQPAPAGRGGRHRRPAQRPALRPRQGSRGRGSGGSTADKLLAPE